MVIRAMVQCHIAVSQRVSSLNVSKDCRARKRDLTLLPQQLGSGVFTDTDRLKLPVECRLVITLE